MKNFFVRIATIIFLSLFIFFNISKADLIKKIEISGNNRISNETIEMFSSISKNKEISLDEINNITKNLYETNFFQNITVSFDNNILKIDVVENPIIGEIIIKGIKAKKIKNAINKNLKLKSRSSYSDFLLKRDKNQILLNLKELGFYFSKINIYKENFDNDLIDIIYDIDLGKKARLKKIIFTGDKIFKDSKLKNIIISEEYKPWKFISGKKYLNENMINLDERLLKNFYLNEGFYDVKINSTYAKLINNHDFELVFNINPNKRFFFNNLKLSLPNDFSEDNYKDIYNLFNKLKNKPYSILRIEEILELLDNISLKEQYQSTKSSVVESINENKINLEFIIEETDKIYVKKINIFGNNVTRENVIRNQLELDEGDPFNEILLKKSANNLKNLNFFKDVDFDIELDQNQMTNVINLSVEEKPTGEIMAGAGVGTSGGTISVGVKENNYLGKGITVRGDLTLREDSIKGLFSFTDPNFKNSDKSISATLQSRELNKLTDFGYKSNKTGIKFGTNFEYLDDLFLGLGIDSFIEKIETDSTASERQKAQTGNYFDNHISIDFNYDKRNQKFQTTSGFNSFLSSTIPVLSETNTLTNTFSFTNYSKYFESNILKTSFYFKSSNSLTGDDIKLSERLNLPNSKLRGFEYGKVGPKDGNDFVGGNFVSSINISSTIPQILENVQSTEFIVFLDIANIWGVDYSSAIKDNSDNILSSVGIGLDWYSAIGPLNFSLTQPITKSSTDITENFRFNLGTTF